METCPCRENSKDQISYQDCCQPYLEGRKLPMTAEALMRARYTAYSKGMIPFIGQTQIMLKDEQFDEAEASAWAKNSIWKGLEIVKTTQGQENDTSGIVEFIAHYQDKTTGKDLSHHEESLFERTNKGWMFKTGNIMGAQPYRRLAEKIGRNDPCSCGSGKKYKKCCGQ